MNKNEQETLILLKEGNHEAFARLYEIYWSQVYNFCRLYLQSIEDCKEVVQQVFIKVWESRLLIKEGENFKGFLFIITRNIIFNLAKKSFNENFYKMSVLTAFKESSERDSYEIEEEISACQLNEYIQQLIEQLPARQKEVFFLSRNMHLSYKEISSRLSISEKTVEQHIYKVLKFLKENLNLYVVFLALCAGQSSYSSNGQIIFYHNKAHHTNGRLFGINNFLGASSNCRSNCQHIIL